jgi:hypothetical protein
MLIAFFGRQQKQKMVVSREEGNRETNKDTPQPRKKQKITMRTSEKSTTRR